MRMIDADDIVYESIDSSDTLREESYYGTGILAVRKEDIDAMQTIVEFEGDINKVIVKGEEYHRIVRCKDCKYYKKASNGISYCYIHDVDILWQDDDFCSRGKRNETDNIR